jgi:hypothetical protein
VEFHLKTKPKQHKTASKKKWLNWLTTFAWRRNLTEISFVINVNVLTCQVVGSEIKAFQFAQFEDFLWNSTCRNANQNSVMRKWLTGSPPVHLANKSSSTQTS